MTDAPVAAPLTPPVPRKTSKLAIAAAICASLGVCCLPFSLVGVVLGILGVVKRKDDTSLGKVLSIGAIVVFPFALAISAAVAIPAFVTYVRRAKGAEAVTNLKQLAQGVQEAYEREHALPASLPALPAGAPSDEKRPWPSDVTAAGYAALGFRPAAAMVFYVYSYERSDDGQSFVVRAVGDLDADGVQSVFTAAGQVEATGLVLSEGVRAENELE